MIRHEDAADVKKKNAIGLTIFIFEKDCSINKPNKLQKFGVMDTDLPKGTAYLRGYLKEKQKAIWGFG